MFSKLKNFSEDVLNNLSDPTQNPQSTRQNESYTQLERSAKILATETPDASQLTQPKDEDMSETASSAEPESKVTTPVPTPGPESTSKETTPAPSSGTTSSGEVTTNTTLRRSTDTENDNLPQPIRSKLKNLQSMKKNIPFC